MLFYTDGVVEERMTGGNQFSEDRLIDLLERAGAEGINAAETVRRLSRALRTARNGKTTDDATLFLLEWTGSRGGDDLRLPLPS